MALHRTRQGSPELVEGPAQNGFAGSFNGRIRHKLLNEALFFTTGQARSILARWVDDHDTERPHSSLGYAKPAAFAAGIEQQRAGSTPPVASPALMRDNTGRSPPEMAGQVTSLPRTEAPPTLGRMQMRQTRSTLLGAVLALVAVLGLIGLSSWHSAVVHDDDPVHLVSVEHGHGSSKQVDPDGPIHVLAHATGQWIALADTFPPSVFSTIAVRAWPAGIYRLRGSIEPSGLLRPPRG